MKPQPSESNSDVSGKYVSKLSPPHRPFIKYEHAVWLVYTVIVTLAIADRFAWNVWPRETMHIGAGTAGSDFKDGLKDGPWTVKFYDIMARASGRYSIVALNLLMFTMMHSFMSWLSETWVARRVLDLSDYVEANRRLHKWNGIGLVAMTLIHVWSILLPCVFSGWRAQVVLGVFEWPLSERGPKGFKDINTATQTMSLQGDDVFRIVEMTILLAVLLPLSIRWLSTRWHVGIHLHGFINVLYFIDIVRRHTHPHSWILNTPFFVAWVIDLLVGAYWRWHQPILKRVQLSTDYMLLFWNQQRTLDTVGPKYYLRLKNSSRLERAHVFTGFENRCELDLAHGDQWSACLLVRVYRSKRGVRMMRQDKVSHTQRIADSDELGLYTWGPFNGSMSEAVRMSLCERRGVTLIGGGSAAGYLIDAVQQFDAETGPRLTVLYTTRDEELLEWVTTVMNAVLAKREMKQCERLRVVVALTNGQSNKAGRVEEMVSVQQRVDDEGGESQSSESEEDSGRRVSLQYGRLDFGKLVRGGDVVYFQGSGGLQKAAEMGCRGKGVRFIAGPSYDSDEKKKRFLLDSLRPKRLRKAGDIV